MGLQEWWNYSWREKVQVHNGPHESHLAWLPSKGVHVWIGMVPEQFDFEGVRLCSVLYKRYIHIYIYIYHRSTHHIYHSYIQAVHSLAINTHCSHRETRTVCTQLLRGGFPSSFTLTHRHCAQNIWSYCKKIRAKVCVATRDPLVSRLENNLN